MTADLVLPTFTKNVKVAQPRGHTAKGLLRIEGLQSGQITCSRTGHIMC